MLVAQGFFAWTVHVVIRSRTLTSAVICGAVTCFGEYTIIVHIQDYDVAVVCGSNFVAMVGKASFFEWEAYRPLLILLLVSNVATDNLVSASLFWYLVGHFAMSIL